MQLPLTSGHIPSELPMTMSITHPVNDWCINKHQNKLSPLQTSTKTTFTGSILGALSIFSMLPPLQQNSHHNKWRERSILGIYLGRSPSHARTVALVLYLETGRVSPQFHVVSDPTFQTLNPNNGVAPPPSQWQVQCRFKGQKSSMSNNPVGGDPQQEPVFVSPTDTEAMQEIAPDTN